MGIAWESEGVHRREEKIVFIQDLHILFTWNEGYSEERSFQRVCYSTEDEIWGLNLKEQ